MDFITLAMRNSLSTTGILADSIFYSLEEENQFNKDSKLLEDSGLEIVATNPEQHLSFNSLRRAPGLGNLRFQGIHYKGRTTKFFLMVEV